MHPTVPTVPTVPTPGHEDSPYSKHWTRGSGRSFGAYELVAKLGVGGMGEAYLAVSRSRSVESGHFKKLCVLKRLHPQLAGDPSARSKFDQEARVAARLNHPNVVQTYDAGEVAGVPYLAMEYLEGQTLRSFTMVCTLSGLLPDPRLWVRIVADALAGLEHAHGLRDFDGSPLGVIHRDVSPHNIFVTYSGRVALIDFGMLKIVESDGPASCRTLAGKPRYMAPEYVADGTVDRRADVFSMGIVLWEALAGQPMPIADITAAGARRPRPHVSSLGIAIDPVLDAIVARATEVDPERRFGSAREMREALERYLDSAGEAPRREDVGELLGAYFEDERIRMQGLVAVQLGDDETNVSDFPSQSWNLRRERRAASEESRVRVFSLTGANPRLDDASYGLASDRARALDLDRHANLDDEVELDECDFESVDEPGGGHERAPASRERVTVRPSLAAAPERRSFAL